MAEKEYIDKETVLKHFDEVMNNEFCDADFKKAALGFSIYVSRLATADVAPIRHGHWVTQEGWTPDDYYYTCSICNEDFYMIVGTPSDNNYKFCPHCGARMDKTE